MRTAPDGAVKPIDPLPPVVKSIDRDDLTSVSALLQVLAEIQVDLPPLLADNPDAAIARQSIYDAKKDQSIPPRKVVLLPLGCTEDSVFLKYDPRTKNITVSFYNFDATESEEISQDVRQYLQDMIKVGLEEQENYIYNIRSDNSRFDIPQNLDKKLENFWKAGNFQITPSGDFFRPNNESIFDWNLSLMEARGEVEHAVVKFGYAVITGNQATPGAFIPSVKRQIAHWEKFPISADTQDLLDARIPHEGVSEGLCIVAEVSDPDQIEASWTSQAEQRTLRGWVNRWFITAKDGQVLHQSRVAKAPE